MPDKINCIFCNNFNSTLVIKENGYYGNQCKQCKLIFISPRPTLEAIVNLYGHNESHQTAQAHINFKFAKELYAKHTLKIIKKYINGTILEIGAGAGYFLNEARKQSFTPYAIEFNKIQADFIESEHAIPCELNALNQNTFGSKTFDVIYHCDVLSHFYNPFDEFKKTYDKLTTNGYVIFETGNLGDVNKKYFKYYSKFQYPDHLFFFTEKNIVTLLQDTGFELVKIYRYSIIPQLFLRKALLGVTNLIKPKKHKKCNSMKIPVRSWLPYYYSKLFYAIKFKLKNFYAFLFYIIRYKLGALVPKSGRPQTLIIVAKKIS